ncbi:hypothetical protein B0H67DRAFT_92071 [Lasiosphaeris hirsuta]|uniref:Uncharacterized protein n=1 Tax=Lasiosphaeris hirsuta TaxID=260670 RepID=A0AA40BCZ7_9PEZI|nr:hypothetical protein B0H67DRAFT_92071 [Lasiosphaeris hirsuta]
MRFNVLTSFALLTAATTTNALSIPGKQQIILGSHAQEELPAAVHTTITTTVTTTGTLSRGIKTVTRTVSKTAPTPPALASRPEKHLGPAAAAAAAAAGPQSFLEWLIHPQPPRREKLDAKGCFCAGGNVCCYDASEDLSCGFGICGI